MLDQLLHSKIRFKLLRLFLTEEPGFYSLPEIAEKIKEKNNSLRKELRNLEKMGLVEEKDLRFKIQDLRRNQELGARKGERGRGRKKKKKKKKKEEKEKIRKVYQAKTDHILYPELKALFLKSRLLLEDTLIKKIQKIGQVRLLVLTGFFVDFPFAQTDVLIVGRINRKKLKNSIKKFERDLGRSINYTVMSTPEFKYRHDLTDQFLFNILENRKVTVIDKMTS